MAQGEQLEVPFTKEEIFRAVNVGLMAEYFLKDDITGVLNDFFKNSIINASSIPKKIDAKSLGDYRPVSFTSCLYKIIARV